MSRRRALIIAASIGAVEIAGFALLLSLFQRPKQDLREDLYQKGLKHLIDSEYKDAASIFGSAELQFYKDSPKKYNYSINLQRYEQHYYTYENLIDFGLNEPGSAAVVDFNTLGGTPVARKTITSKQEGIYINETTSKEHCDFVAWRLTFANYEKSTDAICYRLEANFSDKKYYINYDLDGGAGVDELPTYYYYNHKDIEIPNATKEGYGFVGYESNLYEDVRTNLVIPKGTGQDIELKAIFESLNYTITLNPGEGGSVSPTEVNVVYGTDVSAIFPTPTKTHYDFDYWTYQGQQVDLTNWSIAGNVTLLAHYSPTKHNITYNLHGAADPGLPTSCSYFEQIKLPFVEKENAIFIGWKKVGSGAGEKPDFTLSFVSEDTEIEAIFVEADIDENGKLNSINLGGKTVNNYVIPSFVNDIGKNVISANDHLLNIFVDSRNSHFTEAITHKLLIKDGNIAFAYPVGATGASPFDSVTLPATITKIGDYAFKGTHITDITGSDLITEIGDGAFLGCNELTTCNLNNIERVGDEAFRSTKITETFLTANVDTLSYIGDDAFKGSQVKEINITNTLTHIGSGAFADLSGFNTINFYPNPACTFGTAIFDGVTGVKTLNTDSKFLNELMASQFNSLNLETINITGSVSLADNVCKDNASLKTVDLSTSKIVQVGSDAFKGDPLLESVALPSTIKRIKGGAFEDCEKLTTVNFDDLGDLMMIESGAFANTGITSLDFTSSPHLTIEDHAFTESSKLTSIKLVHGQIVTRIVDVFDLCGKIDNVTYYIPETTGDIIIPNFLFESLNNVTSITFEYLGTDPVEIKLGNGSFKNCASLVDIELNNCSITEVPDYCFEGCKAFTNDNGYVNNCTSYGEGAFYGCVNLDSITFDGSLVKIGKLCFAGCYSLCDVYHPLYIPANSSLIIGLDAFADITGCIEFGFTEDEVNAKRAGLWYGFDEGYSGTFTYYVP